MNFLLDTDTCVYWLRGRSDIQARLAAVGPEAIGISIITLAELRYGAECSANPGANHQAIDGFMSGVTVLSVDDAVRRPRRAWRSVFLAAVAASCCETVNSIHRAELRARD